MSGHTLGDIARAIGARLEGVAERGCIEASQLCQHFRVDRFAHVFSSFSLLARQPPVVYESFAPLPGVPIGMRPRHG